MFDRILDELQRRGHDVTLICGRPTAVRDYPVVPAGGTYSQYLLIPLTCLRKFRDADVVIDSENGLPYFSPLWWRGPSVCVVHHIHADQWETRFPRPIAALCRAIEVRVMPLIYRNKLFVAISRSTAEGLQSIGVDRERIRIIEPGTETRSMDPSEKSVEPLFLSLNRLVPHKRIELLIRSWGIVSGQVPGRLIVAGDGPELQSLRDLASTVPRVEVRGRINEQEKDELLAKSWLVVSASHHEGWGISLLEAATHGTPTLAVDTSGIRDAVEHGVTGVLVEAREDLLIERLAQAWIELAEDRETRLKMGAAAFERSNLFKWPQVIDKWVEVFDEVRRDHESNDRTRIHRIRRRVALRRRSSPSDRSGTDNAGQIDTFTGEIRRSALLLSKFRSQFSDPDGFYTFLAEDTVRLVDRYEPVMGRRVVDVGGGSGYFARAFAKSGAASCYVEPFWDEMGESGRSSGLVIQADGLCLPFADGTFDISHSSNVIEHVTSPTMFFDELVRVVRPGGLIFLAFTNWFSPFGGHETSPWHYLGGTWAARRYERRVGQPPKNLYGSSLFRLDVDDVLNMALNAKGVDFVDTFPRYYPTWTRPVVRIRGLREFLTWNLVVVLRRR
jgi:glycosyltransferase involved in cell wall biosynthesis/SAM-dependent methyltransferase